MQVHTALHTCKPIGLEANFKEVEQALEVRMLDADVARQAYDKECNIPKKENALLKERSKGLLHLMSNQLQAHQYDRVKISTQCNGSGPVKHEYCRDKGL